MKKIIVAISLLLTFCIVSTTVSAAEIIIGGSDEVAEYTIEHRLENCIASDDIVVLETDTSVVGRVTNVTASSFLGYTAPSSIMQSYVKSDNSSVVTINYTMGDFASGDVNCDGFVDLLDITLLQRTLAGWTDYEHYKTCHYTSDLNKDGENSVLDSLLLLNNLANNTLPLSEGRVMITLNIHGDIASYELIPGNNLSTLEDIVMGPELERYTFDGWYDSTFTKEYTVVPNTSTTLYAKFKSYNKYTFEGGTHFDPNNTNRVNIIDNPYGEGKVLSSIVCSSQHSDNSLNGTLRTFNPGIYDGIADEGFKPQKGQTYTITFDYRFRDIDTGSFCRFTPYGSNSLGIGQAENKSDAITTSNIKSLTLTDSWTEYSTTFTYNVDYEYLIFRLSGNSATQNVVYIDNLVITEPITQEGVYLSVFGESQSTDLTVGDDLPVLEPYKHALTDENCVFVGWYDETLTTSYTTVTEGVDTYYAVYDRLTIYTFEQDGFYDPNNNYSPTSSRSISCWYRETDPTDSSNICMRANLSKNLNNTHFALSTYDGIDSNGYVLKSNTRYLVSFDYYIDTTSTDLTSINVGIRGAAESNIGKDKGKTGGLGSSSLQTIGKWDKMTINITTDETVNDYPYFIFLAQASSTVSYDYVKLYLDNFVVREFDTDNTFKIATYADNITYNDNGDVDFHRFSRVGASLPSATEYYGAEFIGWYSSDMTTPYRTVPEGDIELRAKYNADILNFANGGYYDPNDRFGTNLSNFSRDVSPTNSSNEVLKIDFTGDGNTHHFALSRSGYDLENGYKMKVGYSYEVSFMYYAENLSENGVCVHFRGAKQDYIGIASGKSGSYGLKQLTTQGSWTGVTVTIKCTEDLGEDQYLLFLAQDLNYTLGIDACTSVVYFDDIVVKEIAPNTTYTKKTIKFNGATPGEKHYYLFTRDLYIVYPDYNFSYLAKMQVDKLASVLTSITSVTPKVVKESSWSDQMDINCTIFVGDVNGDSDDNASYLVNSSELTDDDYIYQFGSRNVYVNGGSTHALAMAVSELTKTFIDCEANTNFTAGTKYTGKYSEKIGAYSSSDYYKPTFLEDFDGDAVNEDYWSIMDGSQYSTSSVTPGKTSVRSKAHTNVEDGNLVINGAFDDKYYYGGMLRSHGKVQYKYGYFEVSCIIPNGAGLWTATWLTSNNFNGMYYGEIDVNESYGDATIEGFNVHNWPSSSGTKWGFKHTSVGYNSTANSGKTFNDEYHTYGFLWTEDRLVATIDGDVKATYMFNTDERLDSFNDYMSLIVSMTVGNPSVSDSYNLDESGEYWNTSNKYIVDYVHIYQIDGQDIMLTPPEAE